MFLAAALLLCAPGAGAARAGGLFRLRIVVSRVESSKGVIGILLFRSAQGWPENKNAAFRAVAVPAHIGTTTAVLRDLPAGVYAVALLHDVNENMKLDRNWLGRPAERWGMSNNPKAFLSAPSFSRARFTLSHDLEIPIVLQ